MARKMSGPFCSRSSLDDSLTKTHPAPSAAKFLAGDGPSDLRREQRQPRSAHFQVGVEAVERLRLLDHSGSMAFGARMKDPYLTKDLYLVWSNEKGGWLGAVSVAYQTLKTLANFRMRGPWKSVQVQSRDVEAAKGCSICRCGTAMPAFLARFDRLQGWHRARHSA